MSNAFCKKDVLLRGTNRHNPRLFQLGDRAGFLVRQYMKHSLYDRISTRPFLTATEKKWIAFQLLLSVQQAHKHGVCHGDIKMENVMVTSWNWVMLTDFATFKPTSLPEDNPADYSFFFDTSRRRTCYIAPERFKTRNLSSGSGTNLHENPETGYLPDAVVEDVTEATSAVELAPSMDIFSAGCVLIELFTDSPPFNFSNLLAYRAGEYSPDRILDKIEDVHIKEMVSHMIQKDPSQRKSANEYLADQKGKALPEYFYKFFQSYMQIYSTDPTMMPDQKISRQDFKYLLSKTGMFKTFFLSAEFTRTSQSLSKCSTPTTLTLTRLASDWSPASSLQT
jgi:phosphoinositide-3-kinase regulatory subunit 4